MRVMIVAGLLMLSSSLVTRAAMAVEQTVAADIVIYGGTPAGLTAAIQAAKQDLRVVVIEPQVRVGGMISGGLNRTDIGNRQTVGGLSIEFFGRVLKYYQSTYGADSPQARDSHGGLQPEPKVGQLVFEQWLAEYPKITVQTGMTLEDATLNAGRIAAIAAKPTNGGESTVYRGAIFVDATYEGDLLAAAGVPYRVGREAAAEYDESFAGYNFEHGSDRLGDLDALSGAGDHRLQAYNIRGTITDRDDIRIPFPKPAVYRPELHDGWKQKALRLKATKLEQVLDMLDVARCANGKFDPNVADLPNANVNYVEGNAATRQRVYAAVRDHWLSLFYMLQNDPDLPDAFRADAKRWGLPSDEFAENGNITPQMYIREARRMLGAYTLTQRDLRQTRHKPDAICVGSYNLDSHVVQVLTAAKGGTSNEGFFIHGTQPYEIPYRCITPSNVDNLLVTCAISATHVAYGSLRMEPVFMMIGQATGHAANLVIQSKKPVRSIDVSDLRSRLTADGIPLASPYVPTIEIDAPAGKRVAVGMPVELSVNAIEVEGELGNICWNFDGTGAVQAQGPRVSHAFKSPGRYVVTVTATDGSGRRCREQAAEIVVDGGATDDRSVEVGLRRAKLEGNWSRKYTGDEYDFRSYMVAPGGADATATFATDVVREGNYAVSLAWPVGKERSSSVRVTIDAKPGKSQTFAIDQRVAQGPFVFKPIATVECSPSSRISVTVQRHDGTDGDVAIDAVRLTRLTDDVVGVSVGSKGPAK